jgi:serine/threonine-protein kinase
VSAVQIPRISPDGSRVAVQINDQQAQNQDLWLGSVATGSFDRFTTQKQFEQMPVWSSDGASLFMATAVDGVAGIYRMAVGGGALEAIAEGVVFPQDASRDGRWLFYQHRGDSTRLDIWTVPLTNGLPSKDAKPQVLVNSEFEETSPQLSPDGQWLAYQSDVTGRSEIYLRRFVDGRAGPSIKVTTGHGNMPRWSKDGRTLFYVSAPLGNLSAQMMAVGVTSSGDTLAFSPPQPVFKARMLPLGAVARDYDIAPDGRFLVGTVVGATKGTAATVVLNWLEMVK